VKFAAWPAALVLTLAGCGSGSQSAAPPVPISIAGPASCASDQAEDITFSGGLTGHVTCSTVQVPCHRIHGPASPGVKMAILASSGSRFPLIQILFGNDHLGTFAATAVGQSPGLNQQGVRVSGVGDWSSPGGTLSVLVEEAPSLNAQGHVSGSLDVSLVSGSNSARITGSWSCFKTLDGGDGWSSA